MPSVDDALVSSEFFNLPAPVREAHLVQPIAQIGVRAQGSRLELADAKLAWDRAPVAILPKLGIKTWRDGGKLEVLHKGLPIRPKLEALMRSLTRQQQIALTAYTNLGKTPVLYLLPYVDFSQISEVRVLACSGRAEVTGTCLRGSSAQAYDAARRALLGFAKAQAEVAGLERCIVYVALLPNGRYALVELNPALTPTQVRELVERLDAPAPA